MNNFFKNFYRRCGKKQQQMHDILVALEIQKITGKSSNPDNYQEILHSHPRSNEEKITSNV